MTASDSNKNNKNKINDKADDQEDVSFDFAKDSKSKVTDILNKVITTGISAAFMTEEHIKKYTQDMKLPKDILQIILQGANKSKDEITLRVSREVINILNKIDWVKELSKFAEDHKFKVTAEVEILKKKSEKHSD